MCDKVSVTAFSLVNSIARAKHSSQYLCPYDFVSLNVLMSASLQFEVV